MSDSSTVEYLSGNRSDKESGNVFSERVAGVGVVGKMRPWA